MFTINNWDIFNAVIILISAIFITRVWINYLERSDLLEDLENDLRRIREREIFKKDERK